MNTKEIVLLILLVVIIVGCVSIYKITFNNDDSNKESSIDSEKVETSEIVFVYNSEYQRYEAEINDIKLVTEELYEGYQKYAEELLDSYYKKLPDLAQFMIDDGIKDFYDVEDVEELIDNLGKPQIDIGRCTVLYLEHTLDDIHIIEVEFDGNFDEIWRMSIDG